MSPPPPSETDTQHRRRLESLVDVESLVRVATAVDGLVVLTRNGIRRALVIMIACVAGVVWVLVRVSAQTDRLEALAAQIERVSEEQGKARTRVEEVKAKVEVAASAAEERPQLEIKPATSASAGAKAKAAVLVIRPPRPKSASGASPDAGATSAPAAIEIPLRPEGVVKEPKP